MVLAMATATATDGFMVPFLVNGRHVQQRGDVDVE